MSEDSKLIQFYCGILREVISSTEENSNTAQSFGFFRDRRFPWGITIDLKFSKKARQRIFSLAHFLEKRGYTDISLVYEENIKLIEESICELAGNENLVDQTMLHKKNGRSLFDLRSCEIDEFMNASFDALKMKLNESVKNRLVLIPAVKFQSSGNVLFSQLNMLVLQRSDVLAWKSVLNSYGINDQNWDIGSARFKNDKSGPFDKNKFSSWIVYYGRGPMEQVMQEFKFSISVFVSLLIAVAENRQSARIHSGFQDVNQYSVVFSQSQGCMYRGAGFALPKLIEDLDIEQNIEDVRSWLEKLTECDEESRKRIQMASYYFYKGLCSSGDDEFIWCFISLDSLFGKSKFVEEGIVAGVKSVVNSTLIEKNIRDLFDLRCELVHGGIRTISEWRKLSTYGKEFSMDPIFNLRRIVSECILKSVDLK